MNEIDKRVEIVFQASTQNGAELVVAAYKKVIENKFGYSFDKTFRSVHLFYQPLPWKVMQPAIVSILDKPQLYYDKKYISKRTFDILMLQKNVPGTLGEKTDEFLGFISECQNNNNGVCNANLLYEVLAKHNIVSKSMAPDEALFLVNHNYNVQGGVGSFVTKPDGTELNPNHILSNDIDHQFIVNKNKASLAKRYQAIIEEEKVALSN